MEISAEELRRRIRTEVLRLRDDIPENLRIAFSHLIKQRAVTLVEEAGWKSVNCYISIRSEVDTSSIISGLQSDGVRVSAPVVVAEGLEHYLVTSQRNTGAFGVPEPLRTDPVLESDIEAVFIPLVAFDGTGTRLGYGKGYYDRFLSKLPNTAQKIGLAYSLQEVNDIPRLVHDVALDAVITENGILTMR